MGVGRLSGSVGGGFWLLGLVVVLMVMGCSTRRNTSGSRFYHRTTSYFNYYFNARESYDEGVRLAMRGTRYDYTRVLPVIIAGEPSASGATGGEMGRAIEKCAMLIKLHSIVVKPEVKRDKTMTAKDRKFYRQNEFNPYVRKSWLLIAKSHLWNGDLDESRKALDFILSQYPDQAEAWEAGLWLARLEMLGEDYLSAGERLATLGRKRERLEPKRARFLYHGLYADLLIREGKWSEALPHLDEALATSRRGRERDRVRMVLAQVYERMGRGREAYDLYGKVARGSSDYELGFNAKLRRATLASEVSGRGLERNLEKMLRDVKNEAYADQIHYALGEMAAHAGDTARALEQYHLSAQKSVSNNEQKGLSYLTLGRYYYAHRDYYQAAMFYDSALVSLSVTYPGYGEHERLGRSLRSLAESMSVIRHEDSLQRVARMPEAERMALIRSEIARVEEAEHQAAVERERQQQDRQFAMQNQYRGGGAQMGEDGGKWYFYNSSTLSFGRQDFRLKWGDRKLEDYWRRRNKQSVQAEGVEGGDSVQSGKESLSNKSVEYYLHDLPKTDSAFRASDVRIGESMLSLGSLYRNAIGDYGEAATAYEAYADRFSGSPRAAESLYRAYTSSEDGGDVARAESLKGRILREYPTSHYARLLSEPAYLEEQRVLRDTLERVYSRAYELYRRGDREGAYAASARGRSLADGHGVYEEQFALLGAVSSGERAGSAEQLDSLRGYVLQYPQGVGVEWVQEVLRTAERNLVQTGSVVGDVPVLDSPSGVVDDGSSPYVYAPDSAHWVMVVTPPGIDVSASRFALLSFYVDYDINLTLDIVFSPYNDDFAFLLVKEFGSAGHALAFMEALERSDAFSDQGFTGRYCVITVGNYSTLTVGKGQLNEYLQYFAYHYKSGKGVDDE